jgi:hypothetical protein
MQMFPLCLESPRTCRHTPSAQAFAGDVLDTHFYGKQQFTQDGGKQLTLGYLQWMATCLTVQVHPQRPRHPARTRQCPDNNALAVEEVVNDIDEDCLNIVVWLPA